MFTRTNATVSGRTRNGRPPGRRIAAIAAALTLGAFGASAASASVNVAGTTFNSTATCASSVRGLEVMADTSGSGGSWVMTWLYDYRTGRWMHENQWHAVNDFPSLIAGSFNFAGHGYYAVYMSYAQSTGAGWRYSGEYITTYYQQSATGYGNSPSSTCYI